MYRERGGVLEVFLAHPGGPFYARRDEGCWTLPKGELGDGEDALAAARREFSEETGLVPPEACLPLGAVRLRSGKVVEAWAFPGDRDPGPALRSNLFTLEWPPRSGRVREYPEIDRAAFFPLGVARRKIQPGQLPFLDRLAAHVGGPRAARAAATTLMPTGGPPA
jgi:predicted NUDIX family NTP pyrophosphohydrolase